MAPETPNSAESHGFSSPACNAAIDAIFNGAGAGREPLREARLAKLLTLLDLPLVDADGSKGRADFRSTLIDVTFARVLRSERRDLAGRIVGKPDQPALTEPSAMGLDALLSAPNLESARADDRAARAAAVCALLEAGLDAPTPEERSALISTTLARIEREEAAGRDRFRLAPVAPSQATGSRGGIRLADLVSIAAVFLIATAIAWPLLVSVREQAREAQCASNLGRSALGFTTYAADHRGSLPRAEASLLGGSWWDVGKESRSHSANLYTLVRLGYASLSDLSCPGNPSAPTIELDPDAKDWRSPEEVSFSYQLFSGTPPMWGQNSRMVVLVDRSPVVERSRRGERFDPGASSRNHSGHGQNILFGDGAARLYFRPVLENGDNVWLPAGGLQADFLTGRELPTSATDAFVGP